MMRRFAFISCCTAIAVLACARSDDAATDTATGAVAATATPPATISLADVAGRWTVRAVPETGDTTAVVSQLNASADTSGWTMTLPNRPPVPTRVVAVAGDSIVTENGPYESVLRKGVQVRTRSVMRLRDGKLVGTTVARYSTTGADSVLRLRTEATRTP
ncbi:MAG: hypothetical protein ABR499_22095 [Gemmatimonadaceae bacterium]